MLEILTRAGCFVGIIVLGYCLRRINFFKEGDFRVLSGIVIKITLPASIVYSFSGKTIDTSLLFIVLLGLGGGLIYMGIAWAVLMAWQPCLLRGVSSCYLFPGRCARL